MDEIIEMKYTVREINKATATTTTAAKKTVQPSHYSAERITSLGAVNRCKKAHD